MVDRGGANRARGTTARSPSQVDADRDAAVLARDRGDPDGGLGHWRREQTVPCRARGRGPLAVVVRAQRAVGLDTDGRGGGARVPPLYGCGVDRADGAVSGEGAGKQGKSLGYCFFSRKAHRVVKNLWRKRTSRPWRPTGQV